MIPKKPQTVIKQVSEELDLPESMVDEIVSFYYKEIRKNLSSLEKNIKNNYKIMKLLLMINHKE